MLGYIMTLINTIRMIKNPLKYAKKIGVNVSDKAQLLGKSNWGTEPWLIKIGDYTRVSKNVTFWNHDGGISVARRLDSKYGKVVKFGYIEIGNNCFIGANSTLLCNIKIGDNSIVGSCSLVTKDIPSGEVWGGVPAKYICSIEEYAEKLLLKCPSYDSDILINNKKEGTILIAQEYMKNKGLKI